MKNMTINKKLTTNRPNVETEVYENMQDLTWMIGDTSKPKVKLNKKKKLKVCK